MKIFKRAMLAVSSVMLLTTLCLAAIPPRTAEAAADFTPDLLCVLPTRSNDSSKDTYHMPTGWLSIQIINRATMKVTFKDGGGNCANPSGNLKGTSIKYIDGRTSFKPLVDGLYRDKQLDDKGSNDWSYRRESDAGDADESIIDEFNNSAVGDDAFGNANKILTTDQIRNFLAGRNGGKGAEITFGVEEDLVEDVKCPNQTNGNFALWADEDAFEWRCIGESMPRSGRGYRVTRNDSTAGVSEVFDGKLEAFNITFEYDGADTITHVARNEGLTFTYCNATSNFRINGCGGDLFIDVGKEQIQGDLATGRINATYGDEAAEYFMRQAGSNTSEKVVVAGVTSNSSQSTNQAQDQSTGDGTAASEISCDVSLVNPLTWLICPLVAAANEFVGQLDRAIVRELNVNEDTYFDENDPRIGQNFYNVWSNFRNIGLVILVLAALVMVIAQALSIGPFDAYTVKKVLPRILIAVIFMTLSWDIMKFLIAVTNDVSIALRTVIQSPFREIGNPQIGAGTSSAAALLVGGSGLGLGILGLLSFGLTALMAVIVAFLILTLRKMLIIFLVLVAPFAIVCYILPNTQKVYKLWWDTFSKALLMFPIVMGFIAIGRVFAQVAFNPNDTGGTDLLEQIVVMVAYFGPYFALPTAFRLAGGAISTISGMANDRSRGAFDRLKKFRQQQPSQRWEKAQKGQLWRGHNPITKKASDVALATTQLSKAGLRPSNWRSNMTSAIGLQRFDAASEFMEKNQTFKGLKGDDDKLWAIMNARNAQEAKDILMARAPERFSDPRVLDQAVGEVMRVRREGGDSVARIAATRAQAGSGTGFNYRDDGIEDDMLNSIIAAAGNDRSLSGRMLAEMRGSAKESGRIDLAGGGFAKQAQVLDKRRASLAKVAAGGTDDYSSDDARREIIRDVLDSNAGAAIAGKLKAVENMAPVMLENVQNALYNTDARMSSSERQAAATRELASLASKYEVAGQVAPQNADALQNGVLMKDLDVNSLPIDMQNLLAPVILDPKTGRPKERIKVLDAINGMRGDKNFQSMRREYMSALSADAADSARRAAEGESVGGIRGI